MNEITLRGEVRPEDAAAVRALTEATGKFHGHEVRVAVELVEERLQKGESSGYHFLFAEEGGRLAGYACWGPIPCTAGAFDLYWIAVHPDRQGRKLGRRLLAECERAVRRGGGRRIFVETSGRPDYAPTRGFYEACGYRREAALADFYAPGDDKIVFGKALAAGDDVDKKPT